MRSASQRSGRTPGRPEVDASSPCSNPLEAGGLIERERSGTDRRRHVVTITPAGERHFASAAQAQREAEDALFTGLTEQQREQLRNLLIALRDTNRTEPADDNCE